MEMGGLSETVLERSVLRQMKYRREEVLNSAGVEGGCAILAFPGREPCCVCCRQAVAAKEGDLALLIVHCANELAASGAEPVAMTLGLMLPTDLEEGRLRTLSLEAEQAASRLKVQIAGVHAAASGAVLEPVATVTGQGKQEVTLRGARPGDEVVVSKWIGLEGTALLAKWHYGSLLDRYPAYFLEEAKGFDRFQSILPEARIAARYGASQMQDVSEGGIFAALWDFAERGGFGLSVDLKKLPIRQETVEVCEHLGRNPYELLSGGCLLAAAADGQGLADALNEAGVPACVVGKVTSGHGRLLWMDGEARYLNRPKTDEIYKG